MKNFWGEYIPTPMTKQHPMERWASVHQMPVKQLAEAAGISGAYLRNIYAWRREPSLTVAARLSEISGIEMRAFIKPGDNRKVSP